VIREMDGNMSEAARELGIHRATLYRRLRRLGLERAPGNLGQPGLRRSAGESAS
jgi:DNA-binding NtrC family response regulator